MAKNVKVTLAHHWLEHKPGEEVSVDPSTAARLRADGYLVSAGDAGGITPAKAAAKP